MPSPIDKYHSLGLFYFKMKEYNKAIEFFKKVLIIDPDHLDSKNKMRLLIKKLKSKENYLSEKYYSIVDGYLIDKKISVIEGNINFKTWFDLGLYYKEIQMYEQSVASFKNALRIRPNHTDTHFELSSIYDEIENYYKYTINVYNEEELLNIDNQINEENDKGKHLEETMPQKYNLSELHYRLGWAFGEPKYYPHVLELCEKVIEFEPEFADVYYWFGWIYEKLKQYADAVFAYNKAILIDENYIFAYNRLGNIYLKQLKFDEAIEIYKESIKNNPENIRAYLKTGSIYNKILQYDKAIEILKKALEIDPQNFFLWNLISKSYRNLGWYYNAKDALKKVIDIKPDYFKAYKILSNVISNEEAFIVWLKKQGTSDSATSLAINDITEISNYALKTSKSKISFFDMLIANQFNKIYTVLFSDTVFKNKNKEKHNAYFLAMNKYSKFLKQSKPEASAKEADNNHGGSCIPGRKLKTVDEYITNAEIDSSHGQLLINTVLDNSFKNGIKLGSIINIRKFMMEFHDNYPDYKLSDDADILKEKIRRVTIQCPNDLYMTPNTIAKDIALIKDILSYIIDTLKSGKMVIYVENIYNRFKNRLLDTNIYSKDILESLIKHYLKDDIIYSKGTILSEYGVKLNIDDEVLEVLSGSDTPLNGQEIFDVLHHLTHSKIEQILKSDKRSIYIQRNIYWHIEKFEVTEDDKLLLDDIIRCEIKDGFISLKKLLDVLNTQASDFIQKNRIVNHVCLRDVLKYYFGDDFGFQYTFIGRKNEEMSGVVATRNFLADKERFKLSELIDFIGENDLPKHYELFIKEASKEFIRINEQDFIKKTDFAISDLDIKNIEEVIQKYLTNGYVGINKIDSFAIFPTIYFQWNSFLLKSIIETYCYGYEIFDFSRSVTKPSGVVVSKMAGYKNFDEILIDVIAEQNKYHPFQSIKDAQEYLYDNAYITQKKYKNFEVIFSSAKQKTIQRVRL